MFGSKVWTDLDAESPDPHVHTLPNKQWETEAIEGLILSPSVCFDRQPSDMHQ